MMPDLEKPVTLGYLRRQGVQRLDCVCNGCGHTKLLPLSRLLGTLSQTTPVARASRRLLCIRCRLKDATLRLPQSSVEVRAYR